MTDTKLTALTENTDPQGTDILYLVDDPGGTPLSQKMTIASLHASPTFTGTVIAAKITSSDQFRINDSSIRAYSSSTTSSTYVDGFSVLFDRASANYIKAEATGASLRFRVGSTSETLRMTLTTITSYVDFDVTGDFSATGVSDITVQHGHLYTGGGVATQTPNTSYALMNQWLSAGTSSSGVTPDTANDKITVTDAGIYQVTCSLSFTGTNSSTVTGAIFWNGVEQPITFQRKLGTGSDVGNASMMGLIDVTTGSTDIDVRVKCDGASDVFDLKEGQLSVVRVGAT